METEPVVSLVMATFNDRPDFLSVAIDSILGQTYSDWELIIVDDSNEADTIEVIDKYVGQDIRIRCIRSQGLKMGFVPALNVGISHARGKYVGRMDGDDVSYPERLELQLNYLDTHPDTDVVGTQTAIIDTNGERTSEILFPADGLRFRLFQMFRCPMQHGTILMRRSVVDDGIRYDETFKRSEDLELWLRLQKEDYRLHNIQRVLYDFRIEDGYARKRGREHFKCNVRARYKNLTWKHALTGFVGLSVAIIYSVIPTGMKSVVYNRLNGRRHDRNQRH